MSSTTHNVRTLKEFLEDFDDTTKHIAQDYPHYNNNVQAVTLARSRSKSRAAAEAAINSFQKLLKSISFLSAAAAPATLPRSISKKLLTKFNRTKNKTKNNTSNDNNINGKVIVKVKDILKWKSFRDVAAAGQSPPLEEGPTSSGRSGGSPSCSDSEGSSSWDDSEFTCVVDELPRWWGNDESETMEKEGKSKTWADDGLALVGLDEMGTTFATDAPLVGPIVENTAIEEEKEQHSPVSVLNSPFRDEISDEEVVSNFDQSLANVERTKQRLLQSIQLFESLAGVCDQYSSDDDEETTIDEEEVEEKQQHEHKQEEDNAVEARSRVYLIKILSRFPKGERGLKDKEVFLRDLETQEKWNKFEEERLDVGMELEACLLHELVDEVLVDLFE